MKRLILTLICLLPLSAFGQAITGNSAATGNAAFGSAAAGGDCATSIGSNSSADTGKVDLWTTGTEWLGSYVTTTAAGDCCKVILRMSKTASPTYNITCYLYSDSGANAPNTLLATSGSVAASSIGASEQDVTFEFSSPATLTTSTKYWVVVHSDQGEQDAVNYVSWFYVTGFVGDGYQYSADGGAPWATVANFLTKCALYK